MKLDYYGFCNLLSLDKDNNASLETYLNALKVSCEQATDKNFGLIDTLETVIEEILPNTNFETDDKYKMICKIFDAINVFKTVMDDPAVQYITMTPYFEDYIKTIQDANTDDIIYNLYNNSIIKPVEDKTKEEEPTTDKKVDAYGYIVDVVPNVDDDNKVDANGDYISKSTGEVDANGDYV